MKKKLYMVVNEDRFFLSHRKDIAIRASQQGYDVHIVCKDTVDGDVLKALEHKDTTQQNLIAAVKAHLTI